MNGEGRELDVPNNRISVPLEKPRGLKAKLSRIIRKGNDSPELPYDPQPENINGPFDPHKKITKPDWEFMLKTAREFTHENFSNWYESYNDHVGQLYTIFPERINEIKFNSKAWGLAKRDASEAIDITLNNGEISPLAVSMFVTELEAMLRICPQRRAELRLDQIYPHLLQQLTRLSRGNTNPPLTLIHKMVRLYPGKTDEILGERKESILESIRKSVEFQEFIYDDKINNPDRITIPRGSSLSGILVQAKDIFPDEFAKLDPRRFLWKDMRIALQEYRDKQNESPHALNTFYWQLFTSHAANMTELGRETMKIDTALPDSSSQKILPESNTK